MSATPTRTLASATVRRSDPRSHPRYPIMLDLQYKLLNGGRVEQLGSGRTLNISSGGVLFEASDISEAAGLTNGAAAIELALSWPLLLEGACALKLVVFGHIVRKDTKRFAMRIEHHEFRTAGAVRKTPRPQRGLPFA